MLSGFRLTLGEGCGSRYLKWKVFGMCICKNDLSVTPEIARRLFDYDPLIGIAIWKSRAPSDFDCKNPISQAKRWNSQNSGKQVGGMVGDYIGCRLNGKLYRFHRLAWLWFYGEWPVHPIDHINGDPADNRIDNLRLATPLENMRNMKKSKANLSGHVGVSWKPSAKLWQARIKVKHKSIHLGYFKENGPAIEARKLAELEFGFTGRHAN